jgi:NADH:ubiquinone oxidoreductase subunit 3 (subunit A)
MQSSAFKEVLFEGSQSTKTSALANFSDMFVFLALLNLVFEQEVLLVYTFLSESDVLPLVCISKMVLEFFLDSSAYDPATYHNLKLN